MRYVIGYLGGANYAKLIRNHHPKGFGARFILNTNKPYWPKTNCWPIINILADQGSAPILGGHAMWDDNHEYRQKDHEKIILTELSRFNSLQTQHPNLVIPFSPLCERNTNSIAVDNLFEKIKANAHPDLMLVNSVTKGNLRPDMVNEVHGDMNKPSGKCAYSTDGSQCVDDDVQGIKKKFSTAEFIEWWVSMCNGKWNDKPKGAEGADETLRPHRQAWLYQKMLESIAFLSTDPGDVDLSDRHIWKSHADQHENYNVRQGKPVLITPIKGRGARLLTDDGKVLAKMTREKENYKPDGRAMYRLNQWGYELAQKAIQAHGKPTLTIVIGGERVGRICPAFRAGSFR